MKQNLIESIQSKLNEDSYIAVFKDGSEEKNRLQSFADDLNNDLDFTYEYTVEDVLFDAGQNWAWTTIIAHNPEEAGSILGGWQALNPRQQEYILSGIKLDEVKQELLASEKRKLSNYWGRR